MKKIFITLLILFLITSGSVFAQSNPQEESNGSSLPSSKTLDAIKDKVASRVAELNLVEKRGIVGVVDTISDTQIIINTISGKRRIIDVDEFTTFSDDLDGISDIEKGSTISVLGLFNKDSERLLARFLNKISIPLYLNGVIAEVDSEEFTITLVDENGNNYIVDIENVTKTFEFDKGKLEISGFSDFDTAINAVVIGFEDADEENRITASKIIVFPFSPQDPKINIDVKKVASPTASKDSDDN